MRITKRRLWSLPKSVQATIVARPHIGPGKNPKSGQALHRLGHFSKTDVRYWQERLYRQTYVKHDELLRTSNWYARIQYRGKREHFPLGTPNKAAAAAKARDIFLFLAANGWSLTLSKYKLQSQSPFPTNTAAITVGSFLDPVFSDSTNRSTIEG
jgi:hypothetical protein